MKPFKERREGAIDELCREYSSLEKFRDEMGGVGIGVGTGIQDQGNGMLTMSYNKRVTSELRGTATRIAKEHGLQPTILEPRLETQVGVYVSWVYYDDIV